MGGELGSEGLDAGGHVRVSHGAVRGEGFVGFADGDLVREDGDADIAEDGAEVDEAAEPAERAGGSGAEDSGFAGEGGDGRFGVGFGAGDPVDGVFEGGGDAAVVFGGGDDEPVVGEEELFEGAGGFGHAASGFEVGIEDGEGEVAEGDDGDLCACGGGTCGGDGGEFLVEGIAAETAAEDEDARSGHGKVGWIRLDGLEGEFSTEAAGAVVGLSAVLVDEDAVAAAVAEESAAEGAEVWRSEDPAGGLEVEVAEGLEGEVFGFVEEGDAHGGGGVDGAGDGSVFLAGFETGAVIGEGGAAFGGFRGAVDEGDGGG